MPTSETKRSVASIRPPRWAEAVLRLLLRPDAAETVSGDLLEEYRESVRPSRGRFQADVWFVRQVAGFVWRSIWVQVAVGLVVGGGLGVLNLIDTARHPLADDDGGVLLVWLLGVASVWGGAASATTWRTRRFADAVKAGAILGVVTLATFHIAGIARVNLFLDVIRQRNDWQNLVARFNASGFESLRTYANYEYVRGTPVVVVFGAIAGSISGAIGGTVNIVARGRRRELAGR
jgi:hypothetical protein